MDDVGSMLWGKVRGAEPVDGSENEADWESGMDQGGGV